MIVFLGLDDDKEVSIYERKIGYSEFLLFGLECWRVYFKRNGDLKIDMFFKGF